MVLRHNRINEFSSKRTQDMEATSGRKSVQVKISNPDGLPRNWPE